MRDAAPAFAEALRLQPTNVQLMQRLQEVQAAVVLEESKARFEAKAEEMRTNAASEPRNRDDAVRKAGVGLEQDVFDTARALARQAAKEAPEEAVREVEHKTAQARQELWEIFN